MSGYVKLIVGGLKDSVGLVAGQWVYESTSPKGIVKTPLSVFKQRCKGKWEIIEVYVEDVNFVYDTAKSLLGCGYDYLGLFGLAYRLNISKDKRYKSGEYIAKCLNWRQSHLHKATVETYWIIGRTIEKGY